MSLFGVVVVIAVVLVFLYVTDAFFRNAYDVPEPADELHRIETEDGVEIALWRYPPYTDSDEDGEPVFLVHGLGSNHRNMGFEQAKSVSTTNGVADYLRREGYDCWVIDLRGRGESEVPRSWSFDDYALKDIPAAVKYILAATEHDSLHWVGHSMGGMLFYSYAGTLRQNDDVRSAVTLGSPVRFEERSFLEKLSRLGLRLKPVLVRVPRNYLLPYTARWSSFWMPYAPRFLADGLLNRDNVKTGTIRSAATVAVSKVSPRVLLNFADWIVNERWTSEDGSIDYRGGLSSVDVPTLVVVGGKDQLCPKRDVVPGYDEMSVDDKRLLVADDDRFREGYGHVDLVFGRRADEEIYPEVLEWLRDHPMERNTEGVSSQERGSKEADVT